jgi:thiol-disulfide isomerase/thioredoxin
VARRLAVGMGMLVVVMVLFLAGVHNYRARQMAMAQKQLQLVKNAPAPENTMESDEPSLRGKPAPAFSLVDVAGKKVSLADYKGHAVVINFWATYCGPCLIEMPWFEEFSAKYKDKGLVVLGIDQDEDMAAAKVAASAKKIGATYPILMPNKTISKDYALADYLPESFYIDSKGVVVGHSVGTPTKDQMEAEIRKAIGQ